MKHTDLLSLNALKHALIAQKTQSLATTIDTTPTADTMPRTGIVPLAAKYTQYADHRPSRPKPKPLKHRDAPETHQATRGYSIDQPMALALVCDPNSGQYASSFRRTGISKAHIKHLREGGIRAVATLDLHAQTRDAARSLLLQFIEHRRGTCIRVIHGQGEGILKPCIRAWLAEHPAVLAFTESLPKHGGSGALWVLLRPVANPSDPCDTSSIYF